MYDEENYVKPVTKLKYVDIEVCNQESLENFRKEVADAKIYEKLQTDWMIQMLTKKKLIPSFGNCQKLHIPKKAKNFNKRKHRKEVWMTNNLLTKVVKKMSCLLNGNKLP